MKNKSIFFLIIIFSIVFASCASTKEERPLWSDESTIGQVYPSEKFIARIGYSNIEKSAAAFADSELSGFFSKKISSDVTATQKLSDKMMAISR